MMFLIDYPFVSSFLKETLASNNYQVIKTKEAAALLDGYNINWISSEKAKILLEKNPTEKLYTNSENSIDWVFKNLPNSDKANWIKNFKDKFAFREIIKDIYPDFFFKKVLLSDIETMDISDFPFPFVVKPTIGFFSLGVHIIYNIEDWNTVKKELTPAKLKHQYPDNVIDTTTFIIEEYIQGKEYAIDCYFNERGEAVIQNILLHKFASETDVSDRVYYSSKKIIEQYHKPLTLFLNDIGKKMQLKNFPIHIEVRIDERGKIIPIEVNPMRFGGWCTTADLTWFSYDFNPYKNYMEDTIPDWNLLLKNKDGYKFAILILEVLTELTPNKKYHFNYNKLHEKFEKVMHIRKLDYNKYGFFGFAFVATKNEVEIDAFLQSDMEEYLC